MTGVPHNTSHYLEGKAQQRVALRSPTWLRSFTAVSVAPKERDRKEPPLVLPEAYIRWGQEAEFTSLLLNDLASRGFRTGGGDDPPERERIGYSQEATHWKDFRVQSRFDPDAYHVTRLARVVAMAGPPLTLWGGPMNNRVSIQTEGAQFQFTLAFPPSDGPDDLLKTRGEGQEPPAPPTLETMGETDD